MKKAFSFCIFQLDYYSLDAPSHWSTVSNVNEEIYTVDNLASSSTIVFVVRAQNHHGLSPPSPMSKVSEKNELQIVFFPNLADIPNNIVLNGMETSKNLSYTKFPHGKKV